MDTDRAYWYFDDTKGSLIATLACAAFAERQQQDPIVSQDESSENDVESDAATDQPEVLARSKHTGLKQRFLNRLAEVFARQKTPINFVSCTALVEKSKEVSIFIARNQRFTKKDENFGKGLSASLERLRKHGDQAKTADSLWESLIEYYMYRIGFHAREFGNFMQKKEIFATSTYREVNEGPLSRLRQLSLLVKDFMNGKRGLASHIVKEAYQLAREPEVRSALGHVIAPKHRTSLLLLLGFLGRLKAAHQTFLNITTLVPSFAKVNITFVECPESATDVQSSIGQRVEGLEMFLSSSGRSLPKWISDGNSKRYKTFKDYSRKALAVHAEMQMLFYLLQDQNDQLEPLPYLGVSKKTCLLCGHILSTTGGFRTRDNHGKIWPQWTLPRRALLKRYHITSMANATEGLSTLLVGLVGSSGGAKKDMIKESIGDPSTNAGLSDFTSLSMGHLCRQADDTRGKELAAISLENIDLDTNDGVANDELRIHDYVREMQNNNQGDQDALKTCVTCHEQPSTVKCLSCGSTRYCSFSCRSDDSFRHRFICNGFRGSLHAADFLKLGCMEDRIPEDPSVLRDFGYSNLDNPRDHSRLTGLYQGLFNHFHVESEELHNWQTQGTLYKEIVQRYAMLPIGSSGYYRWFLEHKKLFSACEVDYLPTREQVSAALTASKGLLDLEDREVALEDLQPTAKREAFIFYAMMSKSTHPAPSLPPWIKLGFCVARTESEENQVGHMYALLIKKCSFREFWQAIHDSKMTRLFAKYNLRDHYKRFRNFEAHMDETSFGCASVWYLKEFCQTDSSEPVNSVIVDYGFRNCKSARQRLELKTVYARFFDQANDEMELHRACILGNLYEHVRKLQDLDPSFCRLMQNPYPLPRV